MAAAQRKKSNTKAPAKRTSAKRTPAKRSAAGRTPASQERRPIRREVGGIVCLLLALCVLVSYFGVSAIFLDFFAKLLRGLFGYGYWLWAAALGLTGVILLTHHGRPVRLRMTCALLTPLFGGGLLHLLLSAGRYDSAAGLAKLLWQDGQALRCGGLLSGSMAVGLSAVFSRVIAIMILLVLLGVAIFVALHMTPRQVVEKARERIPYEAEPERPKPERPEKRQAIDIPLDDPVSAAPTEDGDTVWPVKSKKGFFRRRSDEIRTPAEVLQGERESKEPSQEAPAEPMREEPSYEAPPCEEAPASSGEEPPYEESSYDELIREEPPAEKPSCEEEEPRSQTPQDEKERMVDEVSREIESELAEPEETYQYPPISLLHHSEPKNYAEIGAELRRNSQRLVETLHSFGVVAAVGEVVHGPSVTRYEFTLEQGVKLSKITNLSDDIALALGVRGVRIAPIPDKLSVVGIEVPNRVVSPVGIRDVLESDSFSRHKSRVAFAVGKDIGGNALVGNIETLPHVLIAGTTGSGKSVCTNSLIVSLLYKSTPEEVRFIMVDPKMVELAPYNGIPHLLIPVVTDPKKAAGALQWAVFEMMKRYKLFSEHRVKKLEDFNELCRREQEKPEEERCETLKKPMPSVVVVIDELADLMLVAAKEVEESICRVAQMGRAAGMHLVIATQRPSADVITGLMKANIPSRIAFAVASSMESRIILDTTGAEKLLGKGDMLYFPLGSGKPTRVQGCFISSEEIDAVVDFVKERGETDYSNEVMDKIEEAIRKDDKKQVSAAVDGGGDDGCDELFPAAVDVVLELGQASVSMLQRRLKLGYARAARLVDQMEDRGIVGPFEGSKARRILIDKAKWQEQQMAKAAPTPTFDRNGSISDVFDSHDALE